ncbi:MAG: DUF2177 family protein, partial [Vicinamibacteraceae bacterium]|nr:DUF2177 family protein [Vicinamibacteraceae bacterium]
MLRHFVVALAALVVLDGLWLGLVMKDFYRRHLAHLARMSDGALDPLWPVAALVYPVLAAGLTVLVLARARTPVEALALGAFFGAVTYAVYDLTNHATLRDWSATVTIVDIAWGAFSCGAA